MEGASGSAISASTLSSLAARVSTPPYDRSALRRSVVHIGVGGFHRSHLATYVDDIARQGDQGWGIVGVGVLASDVCGCHVASWRSRLAIVSTVGSPAATSITRS